MAVPSECCVAQLDTELLIKEVKARPCLYAKDDPRYNDVIYKRNIWEQVTIALYPKVWGKYDDEEKGEKAELVQKRWKNLRACFSRELKRQKDPKWTLGVAYKRRRYLYYNLLSFLKPECDNAEADTTQDIDLPENTEGDNTIVTVDTNIEEITIPETVIPEPKPRSRTSSPKIYISKDDNIKHVLYSDTHTSDPDSTNFALSLVPMLNMIPIDERVDVQIQILSVLQPFMKKGGEEETKSKPNDVRRKRKVTPKQTYGKKKSEDTDTVNSEVKEPEGDKEESDND